MNNKGYIDITIQDAIKLMDKEDIEIIDVRTPEEYRVGHIPNAKLYPLQDIWTWSKGLDIHKKYLLVCRSARRTALAGEILAKSGFKQVYNMLGGMLRWKEMDREIEYEKQ